MEAAHFVEFIRLNRLNRFLFQTMYSVSLKKVSPLVTCLPLKPELDEGERALILASLSERVVAYKTNKSMEY